MSESVTRSNPDAEANMRISIIMMQKNEGELLQSWIDYHGPIVDWANIIILDNGSTDKRTVEVLSEAQLRGVEVIFDYEQHSDFEKKGSIVRDIILKNQIDGYDFCFPLDCDEFLAADLPKGVSTLPNEIREELLLLKEEEGHFSMRGSYFNVIGHDFQFSFSKELAVFFGKSYIKDIDIGYHHGSTILETAPIETNIVTIHFQHKRNEIAKAHAVEKLKYRVLDLSEDTMGHYRDKGAHLSRYFLKNPPTFGQPESVKIDSFTSRLERESISFPTQFFLNRDRYDLDGEAFHSVCEEVRAEGLSNHEVALTLTLIKQSDNIIFYAPTAITKNINKFQNRGAKIYIKNSRNTHQLFSLPVEGSENIIQVNYDWGVDSNHLGVPSSFPGSRMIERYVKGCLPELGFEQNLVVMNGRYRVASCLYIAQLNNKEFYKIIFNNFWSRPHYHAVLRYFNCLDTESDSVVLQPEKSASIVELRAAYRVALMDPR